MIEWIYCPPSHQILLSIGLQNALVQLNCCGTKLWVPRRECLPSNRLATNHVITLSHHENASFEEHSSSSFANEPYLFCGRMQIPQWKQKGFFTDHHKTSEPLHSATVNQGLLIWYITPKMLENHCVTLLLQMKRNQEPLCALQSFPPGRETTHSTWTKRMYDGPNGRCGSTLAERVKVQSRAQWSGTKEERERSFTCS